MVVRPRREGIRTWTGPTGHVGFATTAGAGAGAGASRADWAGGVTFDPESGG